MPSALIIEKYEITVLGSLFLLRIIPCLNLVLSLLTVPLCCFDSEGVIGDNFVELLASF